MQCPFFLRNSSLAGVFCRTLRSALSSTCLSISKVAHRNGTRLCCGDSPLAEAVRFELTCPCGQPHFESSCQNRTWRNLTEYNGRCENPENAVFSRLWTTVHIKNTAEIRVRKSPPISPSSNGFLEKPIRIFDRTEHFFVPQSRFWQCIKKHRLCRTTPKIV